MFELGNFDCTLTIKGEDKGGGCVAEMSFDETYQRLEATVYPAFFKCSPAEQREALLHELCHSITVPINRLNEEILQGTFHTREEMHHESERATSKISLTLDALLRGRRRYAVRAYQHYLEP